jgi:3-deoxy-D-manno-octulosonic-acid transferase
LFVRLYRLGIGVAAPWNKKAAKWLAGRKDVFEELASAIAPSDRVIWVHCSSAGEFEQGKPVIEALKKEHPTHRIVVSFFSPSGYQVAGSYPHADVVTYLPLDTKSNARKFIKLVHPELAIFVKYEFWYHHLSEAAFHHIPVLLISATFRPNQLFFKKRGRFFRQILFLFRHIFVQDEASATLLQSAGINHCSVSGDTRFDRVMAIAASFSPLPVIERSLDAPAAIVAGSTWPDDEELLAGLWKEESFGDRKLIIAPHEVGQAHLKEIMQVFRGAVYYSAIANEKNKLPGNVIIIDNVGMLSRLYQYATITYVGGGFTKDGIHNILEAAVWGKPVVFGPNYKKYREAGELIEAGGGFSVSGSEELKKLANKLFADEQLLQASGEKAKDYVVGNAGATQKILSWIYANRLLTRL